ncbi:MAG: response regulator, partial [Patescibacteria group bacterium]
GLELVEKMKPDIVLLDLILGQKSGFTILEEMKRNEKLRMIPVMILSDLAQESDIEKGKKLGAIDYLVKSDLSLKEVIERVKAYFSTI